MGARHPLPYAFAKAHTLLLEDDGAAARAVGAGDGRPAGAVARCCACSTSTRFEREAAATLGRRIAAAYAGGESSAAA